MLFYFLSNRVAYSVVARHTFFIHNFLSTLRENLSYRYNLHFWGIRKAVVKNQGVLVWKQVEKRWYNNGRLFAEPSENAFGQQQVRKRHDVVPGRDSERGVVVQRGRWHAGLQLLEHELLRTHFRTGLHQVPVPAGAARLLAGQPGVAASVHGTSEQGREGVRVRRQGERRAQRRHIGRGHRTLREIGGRR